ncbi:hypothetical protein HMPREF0990_00873 [Lachnospiraceae bacterium 1_1_57FAA]|nr:hypothetical protein HMPREF0990_00873 [Lachnospiraceae bacterium 1_1_57FAA]
MSQNAESKFVNTKNKKFDFFKKLYKKRSMGIILQEI